MTAPIVETLNLKKVYMLGKVPVDALRGVNLIVESGDFLAILGPSGSGKSTLLNMIGALDKPSDGKVRVEGVDVSTLNDDHLTDLRRRIGFVFQLYKCRLHILRKCAKRRAYAVFNREWFWGNGTHYLEIGYG